MQHDALAKKGGHECINVSIYELWKKGCGGLISRAVRYGIFLVKMRKNVISVHTNAKCVSKRGWFL